MQVFRACLIYMSFLLFCLFIIIFIFILNYVLILKFGIFIYYKIGILLNIYCFIWNYFVTCLEVFLECYELTHISWSSLIPRQDHASLSTPQLSRESCKSEHALLPPLVVQLKTTIGAYVVVVQLLTFLNLHFIMEWLLQSYFSWKK